MEAASVRERSPLRLSPGAVAAALLGLTLAAWVLTFDRMRGMDEGPGTDLGGLGWFLGIWVTMMAAMMLPSVAPMVLAFARVTKERARRQQAIYVPTWVFLLGYLGAWTAYGLVAYGVFRVIDAVAGSWLAWDRAGPRRRCSPGGCGCRVCSRSHSLCSASGSPSRRAVSRA